MSGLVELVAAVLSGSGITAVAAHLSARRRAKATESVAAQKHDGLVAPLLVKRLDVLEGRLDARDDAIVTLRGQAADCEATRDECKRELAEMGEQLERVRRDQEHIRHTIRSTPPGEWRASED